jgi:catechol 2,3-dioxygenase-like lactoylglutathione lyase family enzyme
MNFGLLGQHENELFRQFPQNARRNGKARPAGGDVAQMTSADRLAAVGADQHVPAQGLPGTCAAVHRHVGNLRVLETQLFRKKPNRGLLFTAEEGPGGTMPKIDRVLETALYVDDLDRAAAFYAELFDVSSLYADERLRAFALGNSVLLLFRRGASLQTMTMPGGTIPPHDGSGPLHVAFAIAADELAPWEERLRERGIAVEGRTDWSRGGHSIYFRDPDGHLLELATPGLWRIY